MFVKLCFSDVEIYVNFVFDVFLWVFSCSGLICCLFEVGESFIVVVFLDCECCVYVIDLFLLFEIMCIGVEIVEIVKVDYVFLGMLIGVELFFQVVVGSDFYFDDGVIVILCGKIGSG